MFDWKAFEGLRIVSKENLLLGPPEKFLNLFSGISKQLAK